MGLFDELTGGPGTSLEALNPTESIFGDSGRAASAAQAEENALNRKFLTEQAELGRQEAIPLFEASQQGQRLAAQQGLDLFGRSIPAQLQAFQQGNVAAQGVLQAGSRQFENALLGLPVDRSFLDPQSLNIDPSFLQNLQLGPPQTTPGMQASMPAVETTLPAGAVPPPSPFAASRFGAF